jgi:uncharacterized protein YjiS (DUF1127 family)
MATVINTHARSAGGPARSLLGMAVSLPQIWMTRIRHRRELMGLLSQPEHLLKDVGLQRDEITREGLKPFWIA